MNKIDRFLNRKLLKEAKACERYYSQEEIRILRMLVDGWAYTSEEISAKTGVPIFFVEKAMARFSLKFPIYMTDCEEWFIPKHSVVLYTVMAGILAMAPVIVFYGL